MSQNCNHTDGMVIVPKHNAAPATSYWTERGPEGWTAYVEKEQLERMQRAPKSLVEPTARTVKEKPGHKPSLLLDGWGY